MHALWGVNKFLSYLCKYISLNWVIEIKWIWLPYVFIKRTKEEQGRMHGQHQLRTGGQGRKCKFSHFSTRVHGWTDRRTNQQPDGPRDGPMDIGFYRVVLSATRKLWKQRKVLFSWLHKKWSFSHFNQNLDKLKYPFFPKCSFILVTLYFHQSKATFKRQTKMSQCRPFLGHIDLRYVALEIEKCAQSCLSCPVRHEIGDEWGCQIYCHIIGFRALF